VRGKGVSRTPRPGEVNGEGTPRPTSPGAGVDGRRISRPPPGLPRAGERRTASATFARMSYAVENAVFQWEEGFRALQAARSGSGADRALARAVVAVQDELRKRLGSSFSTAELAALYHEGTDWALEVRFASASAVDAAFYLYMREASDFAGGSPRPPQR